MEITLLRLGRAKDWTGFVESFSSEAQGQTVERETRSGEEVEQDRDSDRERAGARGGPEARGDLDEGRGH